MYSVSFSNISQGIIGTKGQQWPKHFGLLKTLEAEGPSVTILKYLCQLPGPECSFWPNFTSWHWPSLAHHLSSPAVVVTAACWGVDHWDHWPPAATIVLSICKKVSWDGFHVSNIQQNIDHGLLAQHFQTFFTIFSYGFEVWSMMLDTSSIGDFPRISYDIITWAEQCKSEHYFRFRSHWTKFLLDSRQEFQ